MPVNYVLLESITLTATAASVVFDNIPQTGYTDLKLVWSGRVTDTSIATYCKMTLNGSSSGFSAVRLFANGSSTGSGSLPQWSGTAPGANATANTFSNVELYFPSYTNSYVKSYNLNSATENNGTEAYFELGSGLWSNTSAINAISLFPNAGSFTINSTFALYGVAALGTTPTILPKASGGDIVVSDGTYWYHAFLGSSVFTPSQNLSCDYLVVAGGGGGGKNVGGGGGAGGLQTSTSTLLASTAYVVAVGAGGAGGGPTDIQGISGSNSILGSLITSTGGGGGGGAAVAQGLNGGSGGGSTYPGSNLAGGLGTVGQGNNGGSSIYFVAGGGGGAGGVGANATGSGSGAGGIGATSSLINALAAATSTGIYSAPNYYYAGGGGGGGYIPQVDGAGGIGGGGAGGGTPVAGTANTGGGGGGNAGGSGYGPNGASGGSGIVIVRYTVA
jgi:hypothetical protein